MFALARQLPAADVSTQAGKWEKNRFMGVELEAKTLGLIGAGNISSIVARKPNGIGMKVVAFDPYLSAERAVQIGVEKVELDALLARADFITLHVPMTEQTKNILSREALAKTKKGVRIINCARGGLVDEEALAEAIKAGHVAGAAFDVFSVEPADSTPLFGLENVICTPHLGASTNEAQENVALQVAEQMSDYLLTGAITNAVNFPSISAEEAPRLTPFIKLAEQLGSFAGQLTAVPIKAIRIEYCGEVAALNVKPARNFLINTVAPLPTIDSSGSQVLNNGQETVNFLLIGSDKRPGSSFRTDTMVVVILRPNEGQVSLISIPRDLLVYIPDWQNQRINTAYQHGIAVGYPGGGPGLLKDTIQYNLGIRIDHTAMVDFDGFRKIVDTLGGVDNPVSCP